MEGLVGRESGAETVSAVDLDLVAGDARLTVSPSSGRILGLRLGAAEVLSPGPKHGCFPMAPWCGRMRDGLLRWGGHDYQLPRTAGPHAIHGTVRDRPWDVVERSATEVVLAQELADPWPFPGRVTQTIALGADNAVFGMTIEAVSDSFPAQVGWHPWFAREQTRGADVEIRFTPAWQEQRGVDHLPDGHRIDARPGPWDDCFGMPEGVRVTLVWPGELELTVTSPLTWVVVYDLPRDSVCVEPQSGPPNGLNTAPRTVDPDNPLGAEMVWRWRSLAADDDKAVGR
ncbi:aldose epimerase family protein [Nocardia australiensis]|uniref:aldose epimerase family protein n=1 Tax=Nocardia australiensis TaxID=2887191 RepID=UPI001D13B047|nr:aldose 1-epimerase [Nocardia australiensis]